MIGVIEGIGSPACLRRYSRSSFVLSGPVIFPQPFRGTTMVVPLSPLPRFCEKDKMHSAATLGLEACRAISTTS